jgi:uncharacterized protein YhfF
MNLQVLNFWNKYKTFCDIGHENFSVAEMGDRLADLIHRGVKTATCSSYQAYLDSKDALPEVGSFFVVITAKGDPLCICQVTDVRIGSFNSVDAAFAFEEGEDDRTLDSWTREHRRFFGLSSPDAFQEQESFQVVFERFQLVWPRADDCTT